MRLGEAEPLTPEEMQSAGALGAPEPIMALGEPIDPLDDFDVFNAVEDEKEQRGFDPADTGVASKIWNGVKETVAMLPGALRGVKTVAMAAVPGSGAAAEVVPLLTESAGQTLGGYKMLAEGAKKLATKTAAAVTTVARPDLEPEMKTLSRRASWEFAREARDVDKFTQGFNQHLEAVFPVALAGLGAMPVDSGAARGLSIFVDPANAVPGAAAARWTTRVPMKGAVKAAQAAAKEASLDLARARAQRESVFLLSKPGASVAESTTIKQLATEAEKRLADASVRRQQALEALKVTTEQQRGVIDSLATSAADLPLATRGASMAARGAGAVIENTGAALQRAAALPEWLAGRIAKTADDAAKRSIEDAVRNVSGGFGIVPSAAGVAGSLARGAGRNLRKYGTLLAEAEGQLPFFKNLARETDGLTSWTASLVDQSGLGELVVPTARIAANATRGVPFAAGIGFVGSGGEVDGAATAMGTGLVAGLAGAGYGQWRRFGNPDIVRRQQVADVSRYRRTLPTEVARQHFDAMPQGDRVGLATMQLAHPDLTIRHEKLGAGKPSFYYAAEDGPVAVINLDTKDGVNAVLSHEIGHHVARHGLTGVIERTLFGDATLKKPGLFTQIGPDGAPVVGADGNYARNNEWSQIKQSYNDRLKAHAERTGESIPPRDDSAMAQEVFAEHVADYLMGRNLQSDLRSNIWSRAIEGLADSDLVAGRPALKQALAKLGVPFEAGQKRITGSDLFPWRLPASRDLTRVVRTYHQRSARGKLAIPDADQAPGGVRYTAAEVTKYPEVLEKLFDGTDDVKRDRLGRVVRDKAGAPVFTTAAEQKAMRAALAKDVEAELVKALPEGARYEKVVTGAGKTEEGWVTPAIPESALDNLSNSGKYNPAQIEALRAASRAIREGKGRSLLMFYQPALAGGKYKGLSGDWRTETPYAIFVSKAGNILLRTMSREKLMANAQSLVGANRAGLWDNNLGQLVADIDRYLANHAAGKPGLDGIGAEKRDQINALFGINTQFNRTANPILESSPKAPAVIRSRRIDRINRMTPIEEFFPTTYDKLNANLRPEAAVAAGSPEGTSSGATQPKLSTGRK